jgi:phosphatidylethanolamine/phosphatidyl-N-methylethanolamine N-methyltransferase
MSKTAKVNGVNKGRENLIFLRGALKNYREVGMFFPSSVAVAKRIVSSIPLGEMQCVIEIGAGTGRLTRAILDCLPAQANLTCVEKSEVFCDYLAQHFSEEPVTIVQSAFEELRQKRPDLCQGKADGVILSLAARLATPENRSVWVETCHQMLKPGGYLLVQQCFPKLDAYLNAPKWRFRRRSWFFHLPPFRVDVFQKI